MSESRHTFLPGEPVWAKQRPNPMFPARVVTRDDITLREGDERPVVGEGEVLLEFFDQERHFAVLDRSDVFAFSDERVRSRALRYKGPARDQTIQAYGEATSYAEKWEREQVGGALLGEQAARSPFETQVAESREYLYWKASKSTYASRDEDSLEVREGRDEEFFDWIGLGNTAVKCSEERLKAIIPERFLPPRKRRCFLRSEW